MLEKFRRSSRGLISWLLLIMSLQFVLPGSTLAGFGEFTIRDELELARKFDLMIESRFFVVQDTEITSYIQMLVERIVKSMPPQPFPIKVTVVRNNALNAFASAAGHITVFTGLIANLNNEDELASVLAHELAHVSERHVARSIEKNQLIGVGSLLGMLAGVLIGAKGNGESSEAAMIGTIAGAQATMLKYSRENEQEADQYGLGFLVDSGFGPSGMTQAFEKIRKMQWLAGGGDVPSYLTTHPGLDERVGYIQERVNRLPDRTRKKVSDNTRFTRVQMLVQAWFTDPGTALAVFTSSEKFPPCLTRLGRAIALSRLRQVEAAKAAFAEAMPCGGNDALWKREFGRFAFDFGQLSTAVAALQEAVLKNPDDLYALFFYARAVAEQGNYQAAIAAMQRIAKTVPRDFEVLENLARYHAALGDHFTGHLCYAKGFAYRGNFKKYMFHFDKASAEARTAEQRRQLDALRDEIREFREIMGLPAS